MFICIIYELFTIRNKPYVFVIFFQPNSFKYGKAKESLKIFVWGLLFLSILLLIDLEKLILGHLQVSAPALLRKGRLRDTGTTLDYTH